MVRKAALILALLALPLSAGAQTTICNTFVPNQINCTTTPSLQNVPAPDYYAALHSDDAARAKRDRDELQQRVARAVMAGQCDYAKQIALQAHDLDLADKAMRLCK